MVLVEIEGGGGRDEAENCVRETGPCVGHQLIALLGYVFIHLFLECRDLVHWYFTWIIQ